MRALFIAYVLATPILLGTALMVMTTRTGRILNHIDYQRVSDVAGLHRWAGIRLLVLSFLSAILGVATWIYPQLGMVFVMCFIAAVLIVTGVIIAGSDRFLSARPR
jgi:uncharacterized membrane protein HdeD (DUF308 family)